MWVASLVLAFAGQAEEPARGNDERVEDVREDIRNGYFGEAKRKAGVLLDASEEDELLRSDALELLSVARRQLQEQLDPETLEHANQAVELKVTLLGDQHARTARALYERGVLLFKLGRLGEAETDLATALGVQEEVLAADDAELAMTRVMLAFVRLYLPSGGVGAARELLDRAAEGQTGVGGRPDVAWRLVVEGSVAYRRFRLDEAQERFGEALEIRKSLLRADHPVIAGAHEKLGSALLASGEYSAARPHLEEALRIWREAFGDDHKLVSGIRVKLGMLHHWIGDFDSARSLLESVVTTLESQGEETKTLVQARKQLADLLRDIGRYEEAHPLYESVVKSYGGGALRSPEDEAEALDRYGASLQRAGNLEAAKAKYSRAREILEAAGPESDPELACVMHNQATLLYELGDAAGSKALLEEARAIQEQRLFSTHPRLLWTLVNLSVAEAALGEDDAALELALRAQGLSWEHVRFATRSLEERLARRLVGTGRTGLHLALSAAARGSLNEKGDAERVLDAAMRWRGLTFDESVSRRRTLREAEDPSVLELREELDASTRALANLAVHGNQPEFVVAHRRRAAAERALAEASARFETELRGAEVDWSTLEERIPEDSALVSYYRYDTSPKPGREVGRYVAFVARPKGEVVAVSVGSAVEIERRVGRVQAELRRELSKTNAGRLEKSYRGVASELRDMVWDPVAEHLEGVERVFLVPDAALNLVSFAALPTGEDGYVAESAPLFHYLGAERELLEEPGGAVGEGLLAVADPDYGPRSTRGPDADGNERRLGELATSFDALHFTPLPNVKAEAEAVAELWEARESATPQGGASTALLLGETATEAAFHRDAPGKRVLHLATHGFFLDGHDGSAATRGVGIGLLQRFDEEVVLPVGPGEDPLLRSGLALAGANRRGDIPSSEDGILTAEEIASLDLRGVELATLSACATGLGPVQAGEGVFGLRRAFRLAGVRSLVVSLWPVDDAATKDWMKAFYDARLQPDADTPASVRAASLQELSARRERGESTHPFYWGAFVGTGVLR